MAEKCSSISSGPASTGSPRTKTLQVSSDAMVQSKHSVLFVCAHVLETFLGVCTKGGAKKKSGDLTMFFLPPQKSHPSIVVAKKNSSFFLALGQKPIAIAHLGDVAG